MHDATLASLPPATLVHLVCASSALLLGPVALYSRKGSRLHRGAGYAWMTLIVGAALSSFFMRGAGGLRLWGFSPIHLLSLLALWGLVGGIWHVVNGRIEAHRQTLKGLYWGACVGAGAFTLLPGRYLGDLLWHHALGLI
jgi:uncharacterized membrane protein